MWLGMHEPVNTITNIFIIIAAWLAYRYVRRSRVPMTADLVLLLFLLTLTGIGSFLWHGLRTRWALQLDWMPGVGFLVVFTALWFRHLFGWIIGLLAPVVMLAAAIASVVFSWRYFDFLHHVSQNLRFTPAFATITLFAVVMVLATWKKYGKRPAQLGAVLVACAIAAAVFRSIDLLVCPYFEAGTHFLWHLLLSTASCLGIVLIVWMKRARISMTT